MFDERLIDEAKFHRPPTLWLEHRDITFALDQSPQPFLDWALVEAGKVGWLGKDGEPAPLKADEKGYAFQEPDIRPVPVSVASGVRLRTEPAQKRGKLFEATYPWEEGALRPNTLIADGGKLRLWYTCQGGLAYAESTDGVNWEKPLRSAVPYDRFDRTNLVADVEDAEGVRHRVGHEGSIFVDPAAPSEERFKSVFMASRKFSASTWDALKKKGRESSPAADWKRRVVLGACSGDGLSWNLYPEPLMLHFSDTQSIVHFDKARNKYVGYFRIFDLGRRSIARAETDRYDRWPLPQTVLRPGPDESPWIDYYLNACTYYPGRTDLRVMLVTVYDRSTDASYVRLATSRDGVVWHWIPGPNLIEPGPDEWDEGCVFATSGLVPTAGGEMIALYDAFHVPHKFPRSRHHLKMPHGAIGTAVWSKDRMVALEAEESGIVTTVPLEIKGSRIFLNVKTERAGAVHATIIDETGQPMAGRTLQASDPVCGDHTKIPLSWNQGQDLSDLKGRKVAIRLYLRAAKLFSISAED